MTIEELSSPLYKVLNNKYRVLHHLLFWMIFFSEELFSITGLTQIDFNWHYVSFNLTSVAIVYINLYVLIPYIMFKGRLWHYLASIVLLLIFFSIILISWNIDFALGFFQIFGSEDFCFKVSSSFWRER